MAGKNERRRSRRPENAHLDQGEFPDLGVFLLVKEWSSEWLSVQTTHLKAVFACQEIVTQERSEEEKGCMHLPCC